MSEDTNTNEKKFHLDEFAMLLGNRMNARREEGGQVCHAGVNKKQKKIKTVWHGFRGFLNLSGRVNQTNLKLSAGFPNTVCWTSSTFFRVADCLI